jgi:hypothetical protein
VVVNQGRVHVVDIRVCHEDKGYLEEGCRSKVDKYTPILRTLGTQLNTNPGQVLPIVVSTRGKMTKNTIESLRELQINDHGTYPTISLMTLRSSTEIYHTFINYNALVACSPLGTYLHKKIFIHIHIFIYTETYLISKS